MNKEELKEYNAFSNKLDSVWMLKDEEQFEAYTDSMDAITGKEPVEFISKIIESVKLRFSHGAYESTYNALWRFPAHVVCTILAQVLPSINKNAKNFESVSALYIPIPGNEENLNAFILESKKWSVPDKKVAISNIKRWSADDEDEEWEDLLKKMDVKINNALDEIPEDWPQEWKVRLEDWRNGSDTFWKQDGGNGKGLSTKQCTKQWIADLDFLIACIVLKQGKKWREIDNITNPLWFYAGKKVYAAFVEKVSLLTPSEQEKLLKNINRVSRSKCKQLKASLQSLNINP